MSVSVVGYEEIVPKPKFCTRCGKELKLMEGIPIYNKYTGEKIETKKLTCPTLSTLHDRYNIDF